MNLHETVTEIQKQAVEASGAKGKIEIVHPPAEPDEVYVVVKPDGSFEKQIADPKPRNHRLHSIDQVGPFVDRHAADANPVVWFGEEKVVVVLDDGTRRDKATLALNKTPQLLKLEELDRENTLFEQRTFIRLLRVDLADCLIECPKLLAAVRDCNFHGAGKDGGSIQHGRESLGRDIEAEAISKMEGGIPEKVRLLVRVFDDPFLKDSWDVECAVEIHVQLSKFELIPFPMQLTNAINSELDAVQQYLEETCPKDTPIFRGTP